MTEAIVERQTQGPAPRTRRAAMWGPFWALYKKEARAFFNTPTAYIVVVVFLLITGYFFSQPMFLLNTATLASFTDMAPLLLVFFVPAVTMRLFAEELKVGTIEILSTLPVEDLSVMLSKYAAALTVIALALAGTFPYPLSLGVLGHLDWGAAAGAYAGLFLSGAVLAAAGLLASTLTRNQIIAFILGFLIAFALFLLGKVRPFVPLWLSPVTEFLGLDTHLDNLSRGIVDSRDILYYLSMCGYLLYLAYLNLNSRRWR
jgi:ABC-2 type transport system permease protein